MPRRPDISNGTNSDESSRHICGICAADSRQQPIHCIQVASSLAAPPSYQSVVPASPQNPGIPILRVETSYASTQPRIGRSTHRPKTDSRSFIRFRRSGASPLSPRTTFHDREDGPHGQASGFSVPNTPQDEDLGYSRRSQLGNGLGIPVAPFRPDPSPIRSPDSERLARAEKGEAAITSTPNIAQRIKEKLMEYNHSGSATKRWLFELLSWMLSASCMAAIIIILFIVSGEPTPHNWVFGLTLNAYISILSKTASAALLFPASEAIGQLKWSYFQGSSRKIWDFELFDDASRGPWGSWLLLVRTKGTNLASLGAAITVFAIVLDPFFQQVVHYPLSWELQPESSSIPKVTVYAPDWTPQFVLSDNIGDKPWDHNREVRYIADKYFYDYGIKDVQIGNVTRPNFPILCPSSNCTWEPYETLGVCSECSDVADMLEFGCLQAPLDWIESANAAGRSYDQGNMCGWFFNATGPKPMLMSGYQIDPTTNTSGEVLTTRSLPLRTVLNRRPLFQSSINFKHVQNRLIDFVVAAPNRGSEPDEMLDSILRHEKPRALECILALCVKRLESSYSLGAYKEVVTDRYMHLNSTPGPYPWTQMKVYGKLNDTVIYLFLQNMTIDIPAADNQGGFVSYGASNETAFNIITAFDEYLPSFGLRRRNTSKTVMKYKITEEEPVSFREYIKNPWLAPHNVTAHMESLASKLSDMMRTSSAEMVKGRSFSQQNIVAVRWAWLVLPIFLLFLTLIFLIITIKQSSAEQDRVGVWKNSAMANLIYGLPDVYKEELMNAKGVGTPRSKAKSLRVRMLPTKDWRISTSMPEKQ